MARILVVDDQRWVVALLTEYLELEGYAIIPAYNGPAALELAEAELPDLILLDVMMPRMDGYEVCRRLKATTATRHIPVVITWAGPEAEGRPEASAAGAVDYLVLPCKSEELIAVIRRCLNA